jgi:aspartate 1-decarboxylase
LGLKRARVTLECYCAVQLHLLKSKLHRAVVTGGSLTYEGSLGIDEDLMDQVGLLAYERILCGNMSNGHRFETYAIPAKRGSGAIILNGAVARLGQEGDLLTVMSFAVVNSEESRTWKPKVLVLGKGNQVVNTRGL